MIIGFIGTGVMGSRMVQNMLEGKYEVHIYNRTVEKAKPLVEKGAILEQSVKDVAKNCDIICACLSTPNDSLEIFAGEDGVLNNAKKGAICIDFSTISADVSREIARIAREKELYYLDAPVSGGPEGIEARTLTIMVGGDKEAFEKVSPILQTLGSTIEYLGPSGSGSIAKLINQYLVAVHGVAASEAMVLGAASGLDPEQLYNLLKVSYGNSHILRRNMENFVFKGNYEPGGAVKYVYKDVNLANKLFKQFGLTNILGNLAEEKFQEAMEKGYADLDMSAVMKPIEEKLNVVVGKNDK